jgi:hypothetical protein
VNKWNFCNSIENIVNNAIIGFAIDLERNIVFPRSSKMKLKMLLKKTNIDWKNEFHVDVYKENTYNSFFFTREWLLI